MVLHSSAGTEESTPQHVGKLRGTGGIERSGVAEAPAISPPGARLPRVEPRSGTGESPRGGPADGRAEVEGRTGFRILIADDHEAVRRGLRSALSGAGWQVCGEAVDGRDAIQKTSDLKPDLVIMDVSMPNMSGLEAAREILKSPGQTKILVFTMHESKQIRDETTAIGVHALAVKSAPLSTLLATIDSLFQDKH